MSAGAPLAYPCFSCGHVYAGSHCPVCKEEHPTFTALKRITSRLSWPVPSTTYPPCRYAPRALCACGGAGLCLETA